MAGLRGSLGEQRHARGDMIVVRFADDNVLGFEYDPMPSGFWPICGNGRRHSRCRCIRKRQGSFGSAATRLSTGRNVALASRRPFTFCFHDDLRAETYGWLSAAEENPTRPHAGNPPESEGRTAAPTA